MSRMCLVVSVNFTSNIMEPRRLPPLVMVLYPRPWLSPKAPHDAPSARSAIAMRQNAVTERRFSLPRSAEELDACFVVLLT